jgi:serine/threonine-protein kinase
MPNAKAHALELFDEFADMPHHRQSRALAQLKLEDPALHDALVELLVADALEHPLDIPPFGVLSASEPADALLDGSQPESRVGTQLGAWRIEQLLDVGGMGTVYEARRADGHYQQRVALKCIRAELSSPALIAAFLSERNHLAQLEHPHIATLIDGGIEANGLPWFAMRFIDGISIDQWCDQREAGVRQRIKLLIQACDALAYAHEQRVLHQDLKPSNLLVTAQGHVFLVDFGLSVTLSHGSTSNSPRIAISNGYAAPEVHAGAPATVAGDIYAMGVVMYRLLCAEWPTPLHPVHARIMRPEASAPRHMVELLEHAPGAVARMRGRGSNRRLARELAGDLDAIAWKCVAVEPADRYQSATELRDELQRWLQHRPVSARAGGWGYRTQRFLRRNAISATLGSAVGLSLLGGLAVATWQYRRGASETEAARQISDLFEQMLGTATLSGLSDTRVPPQQLLAETEARLRAQSLEGQPALKARALSTLARSYAAMGNYSHALRLATEANELDSNDPLQSIETSATLASLLNLQARHAEARDAALAGIQRHERLKGGNALADIRLLTELARAHWGLSEYDIALATLAMGLQAAQSSRADSLAQPMAELLTLRGQWQGQRLQLKEAQHDLQRAVALSEQTHPLVADAAREQLVEVTSRLGQQESAVTLAQLLLERRQKRLGEQHPDTARSWRVLAEQHYRLNQDTEARHALDNARTLLKDTFGPEHPEYAQALGLEALLMSRESPGSGIPLAREAVALLERALGPLHDETLQAKQDLANQLLDALPLNQNPPAFAPLNEAIGLLSEGTQAAQQHKLPMPERKFALAHALILRNRTHAYGASDLSTAESLLQEALVESRRYLGAQHPTTLQVRNGLLQLRTPSYAHP